MTSTAPIARLRLFGGATLEGDQGPIGGRGAQRRRIALLAILAGTRRPVSRDKVVGLLWEEADSEKARKLLSESLYVIRKAIGEDALLATGDDVRLNPDVVWCDVVDFHAALERGDDAAAAEIYGGPFLDGFFISDAPEFEKWVDGARDTLARCHAEALMRLASGAESLGDHGAAAGWWRKLCEQDPYNATYAVGLMTALDRTGQRAAALQHARVHAALLRSEFDADPDPAITALALKLKDVAPVPPVTRPAVTPHATTETRPPEMPQRVRTVETVPPAPLYEEIPAESPSHTNKSVVASTRSGRRRVRLAASLTVIGLVGIAVLLAWHEDRSAPTAVPVKMIAVFPFSVSAGDVSLRENMVHSLSSDLQIPGRLRAIDSNEMVSLLAKKKGAIPPAEAGSIARGVDAGYYVLGDVMQTGSDIRINATLYVVGTDSVIVRSSKRGKVADLLDLVDQIAGDMVVPLGESADDLTPWARMTSGSYDAFKDYIIGDALYREGKYEEAVDAFTQATTKDPQFALAYYKLSASAEWCFRFALARRSAERAIANGEHLPDQYSRLLRAWWFFLNGKLEDGDRLYQEILVDYPGDLEARAGLAEIQTHFRPSHGLSSEKARTGFEMVAAKAPAYGEVRYHLMEFAARAGKVAAFDSLLRTLPTDNPQYQAWQAVRAFTWGTTAQQQTVLAKLRKGESLELGMAAARVAAHTHNFADARTIARELTRPEVGDAYTAAGHLIIAELFAASGQMAEAQKQIALARPLEDDWTIELESLFLLHPLYKPTDGELSDQLAKLDAWRTGANTPRGEFFFAVHALHHERLRQYLMGRISARLQDVDKAQQYKRQLEQLRVEEDYSQFAGALVMSLEGHIAIARGQDRTALQLLKDADVDARPEFVALSPFFSRAPDRYAIAELYENAGQMKEAKQWYGSLLEGFDFMYAAAAHQKLAQIAQRENNKKDADYHNAKFAELSK